MPVLLYSDLPAPAHLSRFLPELLEVGVLIGQLVLLAELVELAVHGFHNTRVFRVIIHVIELVGIILDIEQFPLAILVIMYELMLAIGHAVVSSHAVAARKLVIVIIERIPPVARRLALEYRHQTGALHIAWAADSGQVQEGLSEV